MQNSRDPKRVAAVCFIARTEFYANACFYYFRLLYLRMKVLRIIALCLIAVVALAGCDGARSGSAADFDLLQRELREGDLLFLLARWRGGLYRWTLVRGARRP